MTIIKILGPSGAGKTSAVRELFVEADKWEKAGGSPKKPDAYALRFAAYPSKNVYVIGSYESNCGGVDTIDSSQKVMDLVDTYSALGDHVIFEGLLQSTYYGKMGEWSQKYGQNFIYAWLNTPLEVCMARLQKRREENGTKRPLNIPQAEAKWASVYVAFSKARDRGHRCEILQWDGEIAPQIQGWLK